MIKDSGTRREFETGAVRDIQEGKGRCDLLPLDVVALHLSGEAHDIILSMNTFMETGDIFYLSDCLHTFKGQFSYDISSISSEVAMSSMLLEVSKHFEEGAKKYGEYNWQKGIPTHCYIDSAVRHFLKFIRGDKDEPHDRAFVWNILCCMWTCKNKPELNDYPRKEIEEPEKEEKAVERCCENCMWEHLNGCQDPCYSCTSFCHWEPKEETEGNT